MTPTTPHADNPDPHAPVTLADAIERYENSGGFECSFPEECIEPLLAIAQAFMDQRKQPDPHGECQHEIERLQAEAERLKAYHQFFVKHVVDWFMVECQVAISGAVSTPEEGYLKDGGLQLLLSDIKRLRKDLDQLRETNHLILSGLRWTGDGYEWTGAEYDYRLKPEEAVNRMAIDRENLKRERDEAVAKVAEARRLLNMSLFDVFPHSQRARDIEAFLRETQPAPTLPQTEGNNG